MNTGDVWNGWKIEALIGEGSFGKVYRVTKEEFGHSYESALKIIRIPQNNADVTAVRNEGMNDASVVSYFYDMVEDIVSEVALMSELRGNSNIVSYEDHSVVEREDEFGWEIYIRMEMLTPLYEYLRDHTMSVNDVIRMGTELCSALELCQKNKVIHRDIKPENIFVSRQGNFKLGDFGIAKQMEKTHTEMSAKGTFTYMAPEVYKGLPYDASVDLYSLGIVLYRLLNNNRAPFMPPYPEPIRYSDKQKANDLRLGGDPLLPPCNAGGDLALAILKACAFDPKDRFESPGEMKKALLASRPGKEGDVIVLPVEEVESAEETAAGANAAETEETDRSRSFDETIALFDIPERSDPDAVVWQQEEVETSVSKLSEFRKMESEAEQAVAAAPAEKGEEKPGKNKRKKIAAAIAVLLCAAGAIFAFLHCTVPSLRGLTSEEAKKAIEDAGLKYNESREFSDTVERDHVISWSPKEGSLMRGSDVRIVISRGEAKLIPDLTGKKKADADAALKKAGLVMIEDGTKRSDTIRKNRVISQDPEPGAQAEEGTEIKVIISKGLTLIKVPDVVGMTGDEAKAALEEAKLEAEIVQAYNSSVSAGIVYAQSVDAGDKTDIKSCITIYESLGARPVSSSSSKKKSKSKSSGPTIIVGY